MTRWTGWMTAGCAAVMLASPVPTRAEEPAAPHFTNVAAEAGLSGINGGRCKWADVTGDGLPDLLLLGAVGATADNVRLLRATRTPAGAITFVDDTEKSGLNQRRSGEKSGRITSLLLAGDVDNDGDLDLYSGVWCNFEQPKVDAKAQKLVLDDQGRPVMTETDHGQRSEILLNDGAGHFTILPDSGVGGHTETVACATFLDYDRDGVLDLFVGNWYRAYGVSLECYPDRLYRGKGDGHFEEVTEAVGLMTGREPGKADSSRPTFGASAADWNDDGWPDLLVCSYGRQWNRLWANQGDGKFVDVAPRTTFDGDAEREDRVRGEPPFRANGNTFDCPSIDFDNDGDMDVFLAEITHSWAGPSSDRSSLLVNQGAERNWEFARVEDRGIARPHDELNWNQGDIHAGWLDADNDGLPDLLLASSDYPDRQILRVFRQTAEHRFEDVTTAAGIEWMNGTQPSVADFDGDGDGDIVLGTTNTRLTAEQQKDRVLQLALWRNDVGQTRAWLVVRLVGKGAGGSNRGAVGARVRVTDGGVTRTRWVMSGLGHAGHQDEAGLCFGLGDTKGPVQVEIRWPDAAGTVTQLKDVLVSRAVIVEEGKDGWRER